MEKKRSTGVTAIGWIETIVGLLGTIFLLWIIICPLLIIPFLIKRGADPEIAMGGLVMVLIPYCLPFPPLLVFGIGILKLRSWARKMQIIVWSLVLIVGSYFLFLLSLARTKDWAAILWLSASLCLVILLIWFFKRPKVKEQFK